DHAALVALFTELGFHTLAQKFAALPERQRPRNQPVDYQLINTRERLEWLVGQLSAQRMFSFDTETTNVRPRWAEIVGYSFSWQEAQGYYLPVRGPKGETHLDPQQVLEALRPILENPAIEKVGQNLK